MTGFGRLASVSHVIAPAPYGGAERVVEMVSSAQARAGHEASVIGVVEPDRTDSPFFARLEEEGVPCHRVAVGPRAYVAEVRALRAAFDRLRPDVVHTHGFRPDVLAGWTARRSGIAVVSTAHGFVVQGGRARLTHRLQLRAFRDGREVITVSRRLARQLAAEGVSEQRVHSVPNALSSSFAPLDRSTARERLGLPAGEFVVGWVGRLGPEKAPDLMLEAMSAVDSSASISIIGDGPMDEGLRTMAAVEELRGRVRLHGRIEDAGRLLPAFDVLALSSRTEGTPIVALEAMASGVPVVANRVGGLPSLLEHQVHGLLADPGDPGQLGREIERLRADRDLGARLAAAARARLDERYGERAWVAAHADVYDRARKGAG